MIWYARLGILCHRITSRKTNDTGNEQDYISELVTATRKGRWDIARVRLQIGIMEVENIKNELHQAEKELSILEQDIRIYENLKSKL